MSEIVRIKELAEKYKLTTRTLRFWEEKGLLESAFRTAGKRRNFGADVEKTIEDILHYKSKGLSLELIKEMMSKKKKSPAHKSNPIRIVIDSTSSIDPDLANSNEINVIPLYVHLDRKVFLDGVNIHEEDFYERLAQKKKQPVAIATAPPTVEDFFSLYSTLVQEGARVICSIHLGEAFSPTVRHAQEAAQKFQDVSIRVFDSRTAGQALTMLAIALREKVRSGASQEECESYLNALILRNWLVLTMTSLNNLAMLGMLQVNMEHGGISLTPESQEVLKGRRSVQFRKDPEREKPSRRRPRSIGEEKPRLTAS
ncbi:MAG: DegV family protein, partial [Candidatus Margulisiibacteriota bacterium]